MCVYKYGNRDERITKLIQWLLCTHIYVCYDRTNIYTHIYTLFIHLLSTDHNYVNVIRAIVIAQGVE